MAKTQVGNLPIQGQFPDNVPVPPIGQFYFFINFLDGKAWIKDHKKRIFPVGAGELSYRRVLTSAEVNFLVTTPIVIVAAPGAGFAIQHITAAVSVANTTWGSNRNMKIANAFQPLIPQAQAQSVLGADGIFPFAPMPIAGNALIVANDPLVITYQGGDLVTGTGDVIIYGTYRIITL